MTELAIDGGRLYFRVHGDGPAMVLVHGLCCAHEDWDPLVERLAPSHRIVAVDLRGHGRSRGFRSGFDMVTLGADVAALIAHLDLPTPLVVGHSMGCRVVLECARQATSPLAGVCLVDGSRFEDGDPEPARHRARDAIARAGFHAFFGALFDDMFTAGSDPALRARIVARARGMPESVATDLMADMVAWDAGALETALGGIDVPVKVLQSTYVNEDRRRTSLGAGESTPWLETVRALAPHAEIAVIPGVGHFSMIEAADAVERALVGSR